MKTVLNKKNIDQLRNPMFLGEDLSLQRYDLIKYPKFYDLYDQQLNFFWRPQEVSLVKDISDYKNLSPEERFVFDSNLKFQTMTDSMLSRSIHELTKRCTNSELEICMNAWSFFETIHSNSYTYILNNVYPDATKFFDSILDDEEIVKRATAISKKYDELLTPSDDVKQQLFDAVLATQITEGLIFYVSFACSFYFGYRGKMEGNSKIIKFISRDENLHVAITQNIMKNWINNPDEGFQDIVKKNEDKVYAA
jgi:ribonucleoside-diphosphate reductase beta chain